MEANPGENVHALVQRAAQSPEDSVGGPPERIQRRCEPYRSLGGALRETDRKIQQETQSSRAKDGERGKGARIHHEEGEN